MVEAGKPKFFYGHIVVLVAFLILMISNGAQSSFGIFFLPVLTEFGWTRAMTSGAFSLAILLSGLLGIVMGRLNDRFGPRLVDTFCGLFFGSGLLLMSQVNKIWQLYLFYGVIVGIGSSGFWTPLLSTVAMWFAKRRGMMSGVILAGISMGMMIMPPIANWLIATYNWRTSYTIIGILGLVSIVLGAQFLRRDPFSMGLLPYGQGEVTQSSDLRTRGFSLEQAIKTKQFWMLTGINFSNGFIFYAIWVHIVPHAIGLGIAAASAAAIMTVMGGAGMVSRLIMGGAGDRIGYKRALVVGAILTAVPLIWLPVAKEVWMLYLIGAIFSLGCGGMGALFSPMVAQLFGLSSHGLILGVTSFSWTFGAAVGPTLAGRIFDVTESYQLAFLACALVSIVGLILNLFLRPIATEEG